MHKMAKSQFIYAKSSRNQRLIITNSTLLLVSRSFSVISSVIIFLLAPMPA